MTEGNFVDYVKVFLTSGNGGKGSVHLHREKYITKGGPDGGDGGRGGHIILEGNEQMWTLLHLKFRKHIKAGNGDRGGKQRSSGADGEDIVLDVPLGTIARDVETGELLFEITKHGEQKILVEGGRGGLGNDTLIGGAGQDTFVYSVSLDQGHDVITDFGNVDLIKMYDGKGQWFNPSSYGEQVGGDVVFTFNSDLSLTILNAAWNDLNFWG